MQGERRAQDSLVYVVCGIRASSILHWCIGCAYRSASAMIQGACHSLWKFRLVDKWHNGVTSQSMHMWQNLQLTLTSSKSSSSFHYWFFRSGMTKLLLFKMATWPVIWSLSKKKNSYNCELNLCVRCMQCRGPIALEALHVIPMTFTLVVNVIVTYPVFHLFIYSLVFNLCKTWYRYKASEMYT